LVRDEAGEALDRKLLDEFSLALPGGSNWLLYCGEAWRSSHSLRAAFKSRFVLSRLP
jgi:hypothetical protein